MSLRRPAWIKIDRGVGHKVALVILDKRKAGRWDAPTNCCESMIGCLRRRQSVYFLLLLFGVKVSMKNLSLWGERRGGGQFGRVSQQW